METIKSITATYEDGFFKPERQLDIPNGTWVTLNIMTADEIDEQRIIENRLKAALKFIENNKNSNESFSDSIYDLISRDNGNTRELYYD
jgi:predicted DNA-binding antitoxin AbrB/MazE fold protein